MKPSHPARLFSRSCAACFPAAKKISIILASALSVVVLGGCAAQMAFHDGQKLLAHDNVEAGLAKFQEALKRDPANLQFKAAYTMTRERMIATQLEQADRLLEAGNRIEAETRYQRVLAMDQGNNRARAGMLMVARDARHEELLKDAAAAQEAKDNEAARAKLSVVLNENPKNEKGRSMLRAMDAKVNAPAPASQLSANYKKRISIEFKDAPLKQVFAVISLTSGLNILFDKDVKVDQKTSIYLKDSTIEAAIYYMLLTNQLEQQVMDGNTLLIYPSNPAKQKDYQQMVVKTFLLANANAKAVAETIKTIVKTRDVVVDEKLNMLIVRDSPEAIRLAEKLVAMQDVAEPEVMLEVEVLEVSRNRLMELGVAWPSSLTLTPLSTTAGNPLTIADLGSLTKNTIGATIDPFKLNARKQDADTNILANPRIRVLNHEKAKIMIGNRVPSITTSVISTGIVTESVNYLDVGLKLDVEPTVYLDADVAIKIALEVSNIVDTQKTDRGTVTYTIGTRAANTTLRLKDGENQVLAGLINDEDRRSANKVPGLGDIPLLGRLFGSTLHDGTKTEIVLSITPHLIRNIQRPEASSAEFLSGTENSLRRLPDLSVRLPQAPPVAATQSADTAPGKDAVSPPGPIPQKDESDAKVDKVPAPDAVKDSDELK